MGLGRRRTSRYACRRLYFQRRNGSAWANDRRGDERLKSTIGHVTFDMACGANETKLFMCACCWSFAKGIDIRVREIEKDPQAILKKRCSRPTHSFHTAIASSLLLSLLSKHSLTKILIECRKIDIIPWCDAGDSNIFFVLLKIQIRRKWVQKTQITIFSI